MSPTAKLIRIRQMAEGAIRNQYPRITLMMIRDLAADPGFPPSYGFLSGDLAEPVVFPAAAALEAAHKGAA